VPLNQLYQHARLRGAIIQKPLHNLITSGALYLNEFRDATGSVVIVICQNMTLRRNGRTVTIAATSQEMYACSKLRSLASKTAIFTEIHCHYSFVCDYRRGMDW
jgi:hypothetical protein